MGQALRERLVYTEKDKCRVCYTCVRECPVKAIKIHTGQAEVIHERCIACGNCVKVCSQGAKAFYNSISDLELILQKNNNVIACLAPSFPAEFTEVKDPGKLVSMIKKIGFSHVVEVAFGADLVAKEYKDLLENNPDKTYISSDCPAIVSYVQHYHPELVKNLAPIVSPMEASAKAIRRKYGSDVKVVFIGPCVAKKGESEIIDVAITFKELRQMFKKYAIEEKKEVASSFDAPIAGKGAIFPVSRGLMQVINKRENLVEGNVISASGKDNFKEVIKEFDKGNIDSNYLELLCCKGCLMGPGMSHQDKRYFKQNKLSSYLTEKFKTFDEERWLEEIDLCAYLDLSRSFEQNDSRIPLPRKEEVEKVLTAMGKIENKDLLNCGACGYDTCIEHASAIILGHAETEMCLPYSIEKLHQSIDAINVSNEKLANAQQALKQSEKLASMGQLSAGIAHELNNPLGVITMYANILLEETPKEQAIFQDLELIVEQTERCKKIVGGLLNFARKNQVRKSETNILEFIKNSTRTILSREAIEIEVTGQLETPLVSIDQDQMMQVLTNLEKNAVESMPSGGTLSITLKDISSDLFEIKISDTGNGISKENMEKLFTPFFTTKEIGKGTGLGLPLVYGIIKMHKGRISAHSNDSPSKGKTGTTFTILLPKY